MECHSCQYVKCCGKCGCCKKTPDDICITKNCNHARKVHGSVLLGINFSDKCNVDICDCKNFQKVKP